jgi:hypothetical protein
MNARFRLESGATGPEAAKVPRRFPVLLSSTCPEVRYKRPLSYRRSFELLPELLVFVDVIPLLPTV